MNPSFRKDMLKQHSMFWENELFNNAYFTRITRICGMLEDIKGLMSFSKDY